MTPSHIEYSLAQTSLGVSEEYGRDQLTPKGTLIQGRHTSSPTSSFTGMLTTLNILGAPRTVTAGMMRWTQSSEIWPADGLLNNKNHPSPELLDRFCGNTSSADSGIRDPNPSMMR